MKIERNMDVQNNILLVEQKKGGHGISISAAGLRTNSIIDERRALAKKQAMKVVSDAFGGEKKTDAQMQSIKDEIHRLQDEIIEKSEETKANNEKLRELREKYGISSDSEENKELEILARKLRNPDANISEEEMSALSEYQQQALYYIATNQQNEYDIGIAKSHQEANVSGYKDLKIERLKSDDILKAEKAAEDIMDAADTETISLATQEAVEHLDEEQAKRDEAAKKAAEEKKEAKKEEAEKLEKEALRQEMLESIKEKAAEGQKSGADIKREAARRVRADAENQELNDISKTVILDSSSMQDTQDAVNAEITNILNRLSLLSNDIKGTSVDSQL